MSVFEYPPQPSAPRPVEPQTIQGQAPIAAPTAPEPPPEPTTTSRRSRRTPKE